MYYSRRGAAQCPGLGRSFVYQLVMKGVILSIKQGRASRMPGEALEQFVSARIEEDGALEQHRLRNVDRVLIFVPDGQPPGCPGTARYDLNDDVVCEPEFIGSLRDDVGGQHWSPKQALKGSE